MNEHLQRISIEVPQVITYERITANPAIACDLSLDIIKSVPEFSGTQEEYVSWRQTATDSYEIFRPYNGSNVHYQAVTIIMNKIRGSARALRFPHNTVLNFDAIIARLDCTYADKTSLRMLRQALDMVRQGDLSLVDYYDEVEKKLTLVTNKVIMTHEQEGANLLNAKKRLRSVVFSAQPRDLPSALALAREAEVSMERNNFANSYVRTVEERAQASENNKGRSQGRSNRNNRDEQDQDKTPHYVRRNKNNRQEQNNREKQEQAPEPMEVDSSSKFRQRNNFDKSQTNDQYAQKKKIRLNVLQAQDASV